MSDGPMTCIQLFATVRRASLTIAVLGVLMAGCSSPDTIDSSEGGDQSTVQDSTTTLADQNSEESATSPSSSFVDMCEVVSPDDIGPVLAAAAPAPDTEELIVGDPTPLTSGECSFDVERTGTGSDHVQLRVGDDFTFGHYRDVEDVTDLAGLGDEAYWFYGVAGPELHIREGDIWLGVRFGGYDERFGLTEDSHAQIAAEVLSRLTGE